MLIEPLTGAVRAAQVAGWHQDGEHDIARHPACPVCHPPKMRRQGCWRCAQAVAILKAQRLGS
jgi:hypothetical protein